MVTGTQLMEKVLFKIAKQWIAGNSIDDALRSAKDAYQSGRHTIINKLGEYHTSKKQISSTIDEYQKIVNSFRKWKIRGAISVKPTQIGLSISQKECYRNFEKIIQKARNAHVFVWLDMESTEHTDDTIEIYNTYSTYLIVLFASIVLLYIFLLSNKKIAKIGISLVVLVNFLRLISSFSSDIIGLSQNELYILV